MIKITFQYDDIDYKDVFEFTDSQANKVIELCFEFQNQNRILKEKASRLDKIKKMYQESGRWID